MEDKIFDIDLDRCVGCYSCAVACMDQNDIDPEDKGSLWRDVASLSDKGKIRYAALACMHCNDAPCVISCPRGAISKDKENGLTVSDKSKCIGCHACVMACPFGSPKFDSDGKMEKCEGCSARVENGLIPACVRVCPTRALKYDTVKKIEEGKKLKTLKKALNL